MVHVCLFFCFSLIFYHCREGILFALTRHDVEDCDPYTPPPYLDFLLVLTEFCHRLLYVDRVGENSGVLPFLCKQLPQGLMEKVKKKKLKGWESLAVYREFTLPPTNRAAMQRGNRKRSQKGTHNMITHQVTNNIIE